MLNQTLVIIPAYNEAENLAPLLESFLPSFPNILVVDDCSSDGTKQIAKKFPIQVLSIPVNLGQGGALNVGLRFFLESTDFKYCLTLDADGQHTLNDSLKVISKLWQENVDIVFGTRFAAPSNSRIPWLKKATLWLAINFERIFFKIDDATDSHNGLRSMSREACELLIPLKYMKMAHATEIRAKAAFHSLNVLEEPVDIIYDNKKTQNPINSINIMAELLFN